MTLMSLPEETFGEKVRRARALSGLTLKEAEAVVTEIIPTTYRSLQRIEEETGDLPGRRREQLAYVAIVAYGFDPDLLGMAETPSARMMDKEGVAQIVEEVKARRPLGGGGADPLGSQPRPGFTTMSVWLTPQVRGYESHTCHSELRARRSPRVRPPFSPESGPFVAVRHCRTHRACA